ncbi:hypothetical protein EYF80_003671 [Liparis tanakae]|uniref:Uncharacterized protein n=1 Tax=Liparis tanakae TaxID=230148 RepID=A0A4Z2J8X3_9TELE|nr:hypothetical protein EYF80_003671 [Liparis tanakae]
MFSPQRQEVTDGIVPGNVRSLCCDLALVAAAAAAVFAGRCLALQVEPCLDSCGCRIKGLAVALMHRVEADGAFKA